jgi:MFS family permease
MWGLFISQGCLVYTGYLYISWLPNYLQTARHLSILNSGIYAAIPFLISTVVGVVANWACDRVLTAEAVRGGSRRYLVVLSLLFMAAGLAIPFVQSLAAVITLITIRGIGRPCRAGGQRRPGRRFAALARRCRASYGLSCPGRQYLRQAGHSVRGEQTRSTPWA